jgi:hypothetical protein
MGMGAAKGSIQRLPTGVQKSYFLLSPSALDVLDD